MREIRVPRASEGREPMTTRKTLKRRVRARSAHTGESYTAARAQVLRKADAPPAPPPDVMALAGVSDAALDRATGKPLAEWLDILDAWGGTEHKHPEIARWLSTEQHVPPWWTQTVTVAYERARGMRAMHERPDGYSVSVSRTIRVTPERLTDAFTKAELRQRWLPDAPIRVRTSTRGRSARFEWDEPPSRVSFTVFPKDGGKTQLGLGHERLPDAATGERLKRMWRERLDALRDLLEAS
jgi:uncharacterized protein YndB with AHSA1/START domain